MLYCSTEGIQERWLMEKNYKGVEPLKKKVRRATKLNKTKCYTYKMEQNEICPLFCLNVRLEVGCIKVKSGGQMLVDS